jgi:hypothetical protein
LSDGANQHSIPYSTHATPKAKQYFLLNRKAANSEDTQTFFRSSKLNSEDELAASIQRKQVPSITHNPSLAPPACILQQR